MCLPSTNIQQQESRAVAGVFGLKFANIIHWLKLTVFGLSACKDSKELSSDSTGNCRCRQPHCHFDAPFYAILDATLVNIRIKLILPERLHFISDNVANIHSKIRCELRKYKYFRNKST